MGKGKVNTKVWDNIETRKPVQRWMGDPPTNDKLYTSLKKMKAGKASGDDGVLAEFLQHAGPEVKEEIFRIVREMWAEAASA